MNEQEPVRLIDGRLLETAFTEWDRRYREEPDRFMSEVEHLLGHTPESYGELAAAYLVFLIDEIGQPVEIPAPPSS